MAPVSPVKRVTRARAAAKKTTTTTTTPKDDMNAPAKKATATKAAAARRSKAAAETSTNEPEMTKRITTKKAATPAPLAAAPRRRVKVTPLEHAQPEPEPEIEPAPGPEAPAAKKTTAKSKKTAAATNEQELVTAPSKPVPRSRTTRTKVNVAEETAEKAVPARATRGRPKKATTQAEFAPAVDPPVRQTGTRAGSDVSVVLPTTTATVKVSTATRKKVTFQDVPESDKENVPVVSKKSVAKKESSKTATGMRAKPIRKPTSTAAATKKKTSTAAKKGKEAQIESRILTPKKVTQIARSLTPSDSEEDELNGGKTPVRDLSMSPKRNPQLTGISSPVKKLDFTPALERRSPEKTGQMSSLLSPARRPPPSPFKDILKDSPRRGDAIPIFPVSATSLQPSIADMLTAPNPSKSTLLQSPKRGAFDNSLFSHSTIKPSQSPFKASLLQSPARRLFSPQKAKQPSATPVQTKAFDVDSPDIAVSSHFRATQSPVRVHTLTEVELARETTGMMDFEDSILNIRSPVKITKPFPALSSPASEQDEDLPMIQNDLDQQVPESTKPTAPIKQLESSEDLVDNIETKAEAMEGLINTVTASEVEKRDIAPSFLFRASRFGEDDDTSEDELQADPSPEKTFNLGRPNLSSANIKSRLSNGISEAPKGMGFTPLANKFSTWSASSPDKSKKQMNQQAGLFSPVAAQHVPGEVQISRQSTPQQKASAMRRSTGGRKSFAPRSSMTSSMGGTPGNPSFFEDEMLAREYEDQIDDDDALEDDVDLHIAIEDVSAAKDVAIDTQEGDDEQEAADGTLTTDMINHNMFTDTAVVDFEALAQEAEELATSTEQPSQEYSGSSEYGDENVVPSDEVAVYNENEEATVSVSEQVEPGTPTPISEAPKSTFVAINDIRTPVRPDLSQPRFSNTLVSKVPLRPEGHISPIKVTKKRSRSLSAAPSPASKRPSIEDLRMPKSQTMTALSPEELAQSPAVTTPGQTSFAADDFGDSTLDGIEFPDDFDGDMSMMNRATSATKATITTRNIRSTAATPSRSPLKAVGRGVLYGAVVHVDVHTTEGADASGIFVELLTQMGAKCVKEWKWNSRASLAASEDVETKVGITHVVYKDGGKRTLEKIRDANRLCEGNVWCVGVGWVLDCEREGKWVDEASYVVDTSIMPRGGSRRRKSMEPRALMNENGSLSTTRERRSVSAETFTGKMREELVGTPVRNVQPVAPRDREEEVDEDEVTEVLSEIQAQTPTGFVKYDPSTSMSPTTPYVGGQGSKLLQMSCPPKQTGKGLFATEDEEKENGGFPVSGKIEELQDEAMRKRLEAVRRKTMGWRPVVGSPLGR